MSNSSSRAVRLVGLGVPDAFEQLVVHNVATEAVGFQFHSRRRSGIDMAVRAADLPLKRVARGIEGLLAVTQRGDELRPASLIVEATRFVRVSITLTVSSSRLATKQPAPVACQRQPARIVPTGMRVTT